MQQPMQLTDEFLSFRNPDATADLTIPVVIVPELNDEQAGSNCQENVKRDLPWLCEKPAHDGVALICGSAPSLKDSFGEIRKLRADGACVFACNAAAKYIHEQGITVDYQAIMDGSLVTLPVISQEADCHLLASILPGVFLDRCSNPILWHPYIKPVIDTVEGLERNFSYIGGGISVSLFTICIAHTLGYRQIHCFGMDSSFQDGHFHINDCSPVGEFRVTVTHNGKLYETTYDMKAQADVFMRLAAELKASGTQLHVHGHGLLPDAFNQTCPSCGQSAGHYDDCEIGLGG
jgi:hypothetical protein